MKIEIMMQKRGEYRPHTEFGIRLRLEPSPYIPLQLEHLLTSPCGSNHLLKSPYGFNHLLATYPSHIARYILHRTPYIVHLTSYTLHRAGINLHVPWSAGSKSDPSYDVSAGSAYTTTQARS